MDPEGPSPVAQPRSMTGLSTNHPPKGMVLRQRLGQLFTEGFLPRQACSSEQLQQSGVASGSSQGCKSTQELLANMASNSPDRPGFTQEGPPNLPRHPSAFCIGLSNPAPAPPGELSTHAPMTDTDHRALSNKNHATAAHQGDLPPAPDSQLQLFGSRLVQK